MGQIGINDLTRAIADTPCTVTAWNNNIDVIKAAHNATDAEVTALGTVVAGKQTSYSAPVTKTTDYTIQNNENVWVDSTSATVNITIDADTIDCAIDWIAGGNTVTLTPESGTINGTASYTMGKVNDRICLRRISAGVWRWV